MESIAIFDDDTDLVDLLAAILSEEGFEVTRFSTPPTVEKVEALAPDVCLVDAWFGDEPEGVTFIQQLNEEREAGESTPPVFLMSSDPSMAQYIHSPHVKKFFLKPLDFSGLISTFQTI